MRIVQITPGSGDSFYCENCLRDAGLVTAMERLLLDPDYARELGQRGRKTVFEKLNIEQTAGEMVRIYEGIVEQFRRG